MNSELHHLALGARDVASLAEFYRDVLGLAEISRHDEAAGGILRSVWLDLGGGAILMIEKTQEEARRPMQGRGAGLFLLALTADEKTVESRCKDLEDRGIYQEAATQFTRYFRDPEGNRFAFSVHPMQE
jgi:catechol-2,3-dioxygenase